MKLDKFFDEKTVIDLSFFNFSNAVTAAYFANRNLEVLRVNKNFKKFFPILKTVNNIPFTSILEQLGVGDEYIKNFKQNLEKNGFVIIPKIEIKIDNEIKVYSLLSAYTENKDFPFLNGIQGQFVDRTDEYNLRREKEELLDQKLKDRELIEEKNKRLENIANRLSKYLSPQVYKSIFDEEESGKKIKESYVRKNLTIFFSDIVNFTDLSDSLEAEKLALILNNYLSEMSLIAINSNATIDKFIGDAILSFHGAPETLGDENDAINCISMALEMKERVNELQSFWIRQGVKDGLKVRYGISSGFANVGDFGSSVMSDYTAIGSSVNLASRLQSIAPENEIIISDTTYNLVKNQINCEEYKEITPKGFVRPVKTYKVISFKNKSNSKTKKSYSKKGKHVDIQIFDSSDMKAAMKELKKLQEDFSKEIED
ncbi:adenylate/guanylate cyclase domain-containing protein [Pelagibacteraceae bacterium]|nr:adenylate/guanylate cyclase domain-containing protein [Pelagibacteraceae bacterium]